MLPFQCCWSCSWICFFLFCVVVAAACDAVPGGACICAVCVWVNMLCEERRDRVTLCWSDWCVCQWRLATHQTTKHCFFLTRPHPIPPAWSHHKHININVCILFASIFCSSLFIFISSCCRINTYSHGFRLSGSIVCMCGGVEAYGPTLCSHWNVIFVVSGFATGFN